MSLTQSDFNFERDVKFEKFEKKNKKQDNSSPRCVEKALNCWQVIMSSRSSET